MEGISQKPSEEISISFRGGSSYSLKGLTTCQNRSTNKVITEGSKEKQHTCQDQNVVLSVAATKSEEQEQSARRIAAEESLSNSASVAPHNLSPLSCVGADNTSPTLLSPHVTAEGRLQFEILTTESEAGIELNEGGNGARKATSFPAVHTVDTSGSNVLLKQEQYHRGGGTCDKQVPYWRRKKVEERDAGRFFANRADRIARARVFVAENCLDEREDGSLVDMFVVTEIDNWNHDRERVVALNQRSLSVINYDFITEKWLDLKRIPYNSVQQVILGPIVYPHKTLLSPRKFDGIKITVQTSAATTAGTAPNRVHSRETWKPFSTDLPWTILSSHPLANKVSGNRGVYQIEVLHDKLQKIVHTFCHPSGYAIGSYVENNAASAVAATTSRPSTQSGHKHFTLSSIASSSRTASMSTHCEGARDNKNSGFTPLNAVIFKEEQIHMPNYLGLSSIFVNQSKLAFALDRNGVCF